MAREIDEAWIDEAIERYRRIDMLQAEFDKAVTAHVVSVHSPDDTVEVQVTAAGEITDVRIRGSLQHRDAADLAREVQAVVTSAAQAARWAREKLHNEIFSQFRSLVDARPSGDVGSAGEFGSAGGFHSRAGLRSPGEFGDRRER